MTRFLQHTSVAAILTLMVPALVSAEVYRFEITARHDFAAGRSFGSTGPYEEIVGRLHYLIDPGNEHNRVIADLDKARKNAAGKIELSGDVVILRPRDPNRANGIALFDIVNRGRTAAFGRFNLQTAPSDDSSDRLGDGFLLNRGYTIVQVGWEFDLAARGAGIRLDVPTAVGVTGLARATFIPPSRNPDFRVDDLAGYTPSDPAAAENRLTVRDTSNAAPTAIQRAKWHLAGNVVTLEGGFEPGRIYELAYKAVDPPIAALGFTAVRDTAAWVKYATDAVVRAKYTLAFGSSQTGRFLREYLYEGFNTDEHNRQVFDAMFPHTAGTGAVNLNRRWATPVSLSTYTAMFFPFADAKQRDPVTGAEEGLLENVRVGKHQPKVFWTNTDTEYWQKATALVTTTPDGLSDVALPPNVREYFLAGTHHGGRTRWPPVVTNGQQPDNPTQYIWAMRALLVAMEKWLIQGVPPPPSRYPRLQDGTLVRLGDVAFPDLPGMISPRTAATESRGVNRFLPKDGGAGTPLPFFVPQVNQDGNETSGIRLPEVLVPLATTTGWNFRKTAIGGTHLLYPLLGSYIPFARTQAERAGRNDPRLSIEERYQSRERYLKLIEEAAAPLVRDGYVLAGDVPGIIREAADHWDLLTRNLITKAEQ